MNRPQLPPIQGRRFDIETLQDTAFSLAAQATKGPTWLRHGGKIAYVVLTEELLDTLWPNPQKAWSVDEMPHRYDELLLRGLTAALSDEKDE